MKNDELSPDAPGGKAQSNRHEPRYLCLDAALEYAALGWEVFPADPVEKKSHKSAEHSNGAKWGKSCDVAQIEKDFAKWPQAAVGIATGPDSGIWVLDVDTLSGHGVDGPSSLKALEAKHGKLPATRQAESPSGSEHYYYRYPAGVRIKNSTSIIGPGIDVRGDGGIVIAPPSVRPGKELPYRWVNDLPVADAPGWLRKLVEVAGDEEERAAAEPEADAARVARALTVVPNDDLGWEEWNYIGMATWRATGGEHFEETFDKFSQKSAKYDADATRERWDHYMRSPPDRVGAGTLFYLARIANPKWDISGVTIDDVYSYLPEHQYIVATNGDLWPAGSVNGNLKKVPLLNRDGSAVLDDKKKQKFMQPSAWLDRHKAVHQMTWMPGHPQIIRDQFILEDDWQPKPGWVCFNQYRGPNIRPGNAREAKPWFDLIVKVYPDDVDHIVDYFATKVQHPEVKINHALVLGGEPGIGKDTILEPLRQAVGTWNFQDISPGDVFDKFNPYLKSVVLRINEARDLGGDSRVDMWQFYEAMKTVSAAPPNMSRVNEKYMKPYSVANICGVIITSNHKINGLYLPANDRRNYVAWSDITSVEFEDGYFASMWKWYQAGGGYQAVAAYLAQRDISSFDPKAPPRKTAAFWEIVEAGQAPEDAEIADVIDAIGSPPALTIDMICASGHTPNTLVMWLRDRKNARSIPHRLGQCGYVPVRNDSDKANGMFRVNGRRQRVYARLELSIRERATVARLLAAEPIDPVVKVEVDIDWSTFKVGGKLLNLKN